MARRFLTLATSALLSSMLSQQVNANTDSSVPGASRYTCPVTLPPAGGERYGNDALQTGLYPEGRVVFEPGGPGYVLADGALGMKFWWWRLKPGRLTFVGKRLDAPSPPLRADVPEGYGDDGFQAVGLIFPTPGCWEVVGRVGDGRLSFVTSVEKIGDGPCSRERREANEVLGKIKTNAWRESAHGDPAGGVKLVRANAEREYDSGEAGLRGTSQAEFLLARRNDEAATFVGYEKVTGSIGGLSGSFVVEHRGAIESGIARSKWEIVAASGTGALEGIAGKGTFDSGRDGRACYSLVHSVLHVRR